jgi:hypothetical protein
MPQKENREKESAEVTLRDVEREMAKPRMAESVRQVAVNSDMDKSSDGAGKL